MPRGTRERANVDGHGAYPGRAGANAAALCDDVYVCAAAPLDHQDYGHAGGVHREHAHGHAPCRHAHVCARELLSGAATPQLP